MLIPALRSALSRQITACLLAGLAAGLPLGCTKKAPSIAPAKPPDVAYVHPTIEKVRDYEDFTGRTESRPYVEVRARVTGELIKVYFKDGTEVNKGDPLFEIDPRTFDADLKSATATVHQMDGDLRRKKILYDRALELRRKGTNSQEDLDNAKADFDVATALLELAKAKEKTAKLNLEFCSIDAAESGRIDQKMIDIGNQVTANVTLLTTIRGENPIYANFDIDERTLLKLRRQLIIGEIKSARETRARLDVGLADEDGFSTTGIIDFVPNSLDAGTGTLRVRVQIENPTHEELIGAIIHRVVASIENAAHVSVDFKLSNRRLMTASMFVRVRFWIGEPVSAILVPEAALVSDQGIRHLFVLNAKDEVEYRPVEIGLQHGSMRVVKSGVGTSDRVIVSGLQRVRAGIKVNAAEKHEKKAVASN
jgi:RND family efflux transporter MFP subunit